MPSACESLVERPRRNCTHTKCMQGSNSMVLYSSVCVQLKGHIGEQALSNPGIVKGGGEGFFYREVSPGHKLKKALRVRSSVGN